MEHPELFRPEEYEKLRGQLLPVYSLTAGLSNRTVRKAMQQLLDMKPSERDYLPDEIRASYDLCGISDALRQIHFPESRAVLQKARSRLAFDEFFLFQMYMCLAINWFGQASLSIKEKDFRFNMEEAYE